MKWSKEVKAVLKEALRGTDGLAAMLVMTTHFKDAQDALFLLADEVLCHYLSSRTPAVKGTYLL